ncbi:hypothetical protein EGJ86_18405 [Pseudomonas sp. o96-267]|uniref:hypothetical protein n=1 Tax=Pseudomonas sp. o96-267 TaxID=2479853 RepID=UPI000F77F291|nr:hypothetical protein [Pseudomonas sp. o96-267]RRV32165.1 hypothetical protein EGJ86_18405 [Pseudomonas sp. o96-267]
MKKTALWLLLFALLIAAAGYIVSLLIFCDPLTTKSLTCHPLKSFPEYYADNIRGHLFAGFLALGGFLLSLKTFIIVTMKENVYDNPKYIEKWQSANKENPSLKLYLPLKQLSDFLYYAIIASISTAVFQLTIGLYEHWITALISTASSIYATLLLSWCLLLIKRNLDTWFEYLDT